MKNNQYTATPNWFKDVQQQQQVVTTQTNYYIGGASGSGGLQFINLYNKFKIESYRITVDDLLINNNAIIAADTPLSEGEERPEGFVSEIGNNVEAENWHTSYLISVVPNTNLVANLKANSNRYGIVFYDEYNQSISGYTSIIDELVTIPVPEKARYFRCCHYIEPAIEPVESTDSETEEPVEPTYEFYIEYAGIGSYDDSDLNTAYGDVFENFTNINSSVPEGINIKQLNTSDLNLIFQQPLSCTVDKSNNIKIGLDKVFTESIGNQDLWELIEDEQGNKYIVTDYNIVGRGGITAYYDGDLTPGSGGGLGGGSLADIEVIGEGNALINAYLNEDKSIITFEKKWLIDADSEQDINGIKNFKNGFKLNNQLINIIDGVLYLDCSIAVTGGITAYATMPGEGSSSIMDQLVVDTKYFIITEGGVLTIVPGSVGGISNIYVTGNGNALTTVTLSEDGKTVSFTKDKNFADQAEMSVYKAEVNQTIAEFKNDVNEQLKHFVTLDTEQEITAIKHFIEGVTIGSNKHKFYEKDGVLWLEGDIAITGGITTYATENIDVSTIMDGVTVDEVTLTKENGVIKIKNAGSGSSFDKTAMWAALSAATNEQINISHLTTALSGYAIKSDLNISNWNTAYKNTHTHSNKTVLDGITSSKITNWDAAYSWGNHAVAGYAKQTSLDTVSIKLNNFLEGSDTDTIINKWKELEAFLEGMSESDNLAEILSTKADKNYVDEELKKYVTLSTKQTISGAKTFTSLLTTAAIKASGDISTPNVRTSDSVYINGVRLYKSANGTLKLDGNLLVTGGITAYSTGEEGGSSGGGIDVEVLWEILGGTGTQQINKTHLTNALSGYATESWVTSKNYAVKATTLAGYGITDVYTKTDSDNRYVNITGDFMQGDLTIPQGKYLYGASEPDGAMLFFDGVKTILGSIGASSTSATHIRSKTGHVTVGTSNTAAYTIWDSGNDGSGSGLDADLLDGAHRKNANGGVLTLVNYPSYQSISPSAITSDYLQKVLGWAYNNHNNGDNTLLIGVARPNSSGNMQIQIYGDDPINDSGYPRYSSGLFINLGGNFKVFGTNGYSYYEETVAYTTSNVASATKLQTPRTIWGQSFDGTANISGNMTGVHHIYHDGYFVYTGLSGKNINTIDYYPGGSVTFGHGQAGNNIDSHLEGRNIHFHTSSDHNIRMTISEAGNVGIGTTIPSEILEINGNTKANTFISRVGTGTAPLTVASTTKVTNLNADLLDGVHNGDLTAAYTHGGSLSANYEVIKNDNSGYPVYILIANCTSTVNASSNGKHYGFTGIIIERRTSGYLFEKVSKVTARIGYSVNSKSLTSDNSSIIPCIIKYGSNYYIALRTIGASHNLYFYGYSVNLLSSFIQVNTTDSSGTLPSGYTIAYNGSAMGVYGNASSATKLQTARSLWGQSFDGTANVTGALTSVTNITASGSISCGSLRTTDISGNGSALYLGNSSNSSYVYLREDMKSSNGNWSIPISGNATFNSVTINSYLTLPYTGGMWISLATRSNIMQSNQNQSQSGAHGLYKVKTYSGHAVCFGGLGNEVGFYGFYKSRIDANDNGTDWSTTWDSSNGTLTHRGNFISTGDIKVGSDYRMYKDSTGALVLEGDIKVNGNILSTGGVTAYTSSAASGTQFLYDVSSYDAYTSTSTTRAPSVRAVKLIKDKVNSVSSTATSALSKLARIKSELSSLSSSSSSSSIGAALRRIADSI